MIAIVGVLILAGAGMGIAVISAIAARHPDRAATMVVLAAAAGGFGVFLLGIMAGLGIAAPGAPAAPQPTVIHFSPWRLTIGLGAAVVLVATAAALIRTGEWRRPDDPPEQL